MAAAQGQGTVTSLSSYVVARASAPSVAAPAASPTPMAALSAATARLGEWMQSPDAEANILVAPPLDRALRQVLAAAAAGATLEEVLQANHGGPDPAAPEGVERQVWAQPGALFRTAFLAAIDPHGEDAPAGWQGEELAHWPDAAASGVWALLPGSTLAATLSPQTRLVVGDRLRIQWSAAALSTVMATFDLEGGGRLQVQALAWTSGVRRLDLANFQVDGVPLNDGVRLLRLQPRTGTLATALPSLAQALSEAIPALLADAGTTEGELLLPFLSVRNAQPSSSGWVHRGLSSSSLLGGLTLALDEARADLRNVDGGGTFLRDEAYAALSIDSRGGDIDASHAMAFTSSLANAYAGAPMGYGFVGLDLPPAFGLSCTASRVLRSAFLATVDRQGRLLHLVALRRPAGEGCT
jgi:hypothetical protein